LRIDRELHETLLAGFGNFAEAKALVLSNCKITRMAVVWCGSMRL
jgi:hypothetical protein